MPCMRADEPKPAAPPKIALKSNAPAKMRRSTSGSMPALITMTMSAMMMYSTPMTGHEHARDLDDAVAVAEDADAYKEREQRAADDRQEMRARGSDERIIEVIARHAVDEVEGGEHVEADRIGRDQRDRENNAEAPASESRLDIVGRAAVAAALGAALFIDLRERALDQRRSRRQPER